MTAADEPGAGNRFDSIAGSFATLYCGTSQGVCFAETLSRFRPDPNLQRLVADEWDELGWMRTGNVPKHWRDERRVVLLSVEPDADFLDVEDHGTRLHLEQELRAPLTYFGVDELDVSVIRGGDRRVTRMIAEWAFTRTGDAGEYLYSGIRYLSRLDTDWECWAIFQGTSVVMRESPSRIDLSNGSLREVAQRFGLILH